MSAIVVLTNGVFPYFNHGFSPIEMPGALPIIEVAL